MAHLKPPIIFHYSVTHLCQCNNQRKSVFKICFSYTWANATQHLIHPVLKAQQNSTWVFRHPNFLDSLLNYSVRGKLGSVILRRSDMRAVFNWWLRIIWKYLSSLGCPSILLVSLRVAFMDHVSVFKPDNEITSFLLCFCKFFAVLCKEFSLSQV